MKKRYFSAYHKFPLRFLQRCLRQLSFNSQQILYHWNDKIILILQQHSLQYFINGTLEHSITIELQQ